MSTTNDDDGVSQRNERDDDDDDDARDSCHRDACDATRRNLQDATRTGVFRARERERINTRVAPTSIRVARQSTRARVDEYI
jgi:hypothetical protein